MCNAADCCAVTHNCRSGQFSSDLWSKSDCSNCRSYDDTAEGDWLGKTGMDTLDQELILELVVMVLVLEWFIGIGVENFT